MTPGDTVFIIEGWFGDLEWIEGVYADKSEALAECERLWKTRTSKQDVAEWLQRHCKFAVVEHELL